MNKVHKYRIGMVLGMDFPPDNRVEKEICRLTAAGQEIYLLCAAYGNEPEEEEYCGARIIRIKIKKSINKKLRGSTATIIDLNTIWWSKQIKKYLRLYKIDILHIHNLYLIGAALKARKESKIKCLVYGDLHENYADAVMHYKFASRFPGKLLISARRWKKAERDWISQLDSAIVVVNEMKKRISEYIDPDKIIVCENCPELSTYRLSTLSDQDSAKYQDRYVISYIGAFDRHRGIETLLKSVQLLRNKIPELKCCIVGGGSIAEELKNLSRDLAILDMVEFEGWKKPEELPGYFDISDIGVIPHIKSVQTDNSSPNKLFEYMYNLVPVITTNCRSLVRVIRETGAGLIYESGNSKELADQILRLYKNRDEAAEMARLGKKAVMERYNWGYCSRELVKLYQQRNEG